MLVHPYPVLAVMMLNYILVMALTWWRWEFSVASLFVAVIGTFVFGFADFRHEGFFILIKDFDAVIDLFPVDDSAISIQLIEVGKQC